MLETRRPTIRLTSLLATLGTACTVALARAESAAPVVVVRAELSDTTETLRLTATVTAERRAGLSPRVPGLVAAVHVDAGDEVAEGDVLVELDRELAELELAAARAAVVEARARLVEARRLREEASELVAEQHLPETEGRARQARVDVESATVARLEVEVREQTERIERHAIVAPFDGVVRRKLTEVGEWVETGTPVVDIVATDRLRLDVQVPQERYPVIDRATPVEVRLDALPGRRFPGRITARVPVNDPSARTFLVRVVVDDPDGSMIPGMSAQVSFGVGGDRSSVVVPRDALVREPDGSYRLWVLEEADGETRVSPRAVRIGRALAETVEIVEGLERPTKVVVRGNESLREGQTVRVVEEAGAPR